MMLDITPQDIHEAYTEGEEAVRNLFDKITTQHISLLNRLSEIEKIKTLPEIDRLEIRLIEIEEKTKMLEKIMLG